jgi:bifunctional UDP-N-acetylglucosamine pyrophosphorylase/glucosamine-1-phosphate N-acetyltransferase
MNNLDVIVLAAGKGVRMKSDIPKVLHLLCGKPMIEHVIETILNLNPNRIYLVVGYQSDKIKEFVNEKFISKLNKIEFVTQEQQLGSGHAVRCVTSYIKDTDGDILIMYGDTPLITNKTLDKLITTHKKNNNDLTLLTARVNNPFGYGRIITDEKANVVEIKEELDLSDIEKEIKEINVGVYCIRKELIIKNIDKIKINERKNEYYFTDIVKILYQQNKKIKVVLTDNNDEIIGINTKDEIIHAEKLLQERFKICTIN